MILWFCENSWVRNKFPRVLATGWRLARSSAYLYLIKQIYNVSTCETLSKRRFFEKYSYLPAYVFVIRSISYTNLRALIDYVCTLIIYYVFCVLRAGTNGPEQWLSIGVIQTHRRGDSKSSGKRKKP